MFIEQLTVYHVQDVVKLFSKHLESFENDKVKDFKITWDYQVKPFKDRIKVSIISKSGENNLTMFLKDYESKLIVDSSRNFNSYISKQFHSDYIRYMEKTFREQNYKRKFVEHHTNKIFKSANRKIEKLEDVFIK